jgi:orotate phosphoribosyltransferase
VTDAELAGAIGAKALLEGDFVLRSGRRSRYYLDKYRFETDPELLRLLGERLAEAVAAYEPSSTLLAAPELGAVLLVTATSLASGHPFLVVRNQAKAYGTGNRLEGVYEPGARVCMIEDIVTSGGAAAESVQALREAGLECRTVVCVVDREEGGSEELRRHAVELRSLFRAKEILETGKTAANPHG